MPSSKMIEITILGSGIFIPTKKQNSAGYLIKINNEYILLDCGSGTLRRLIDLDFDWRKINYIFISHTHPDHVADLPTVIHSQLLRKRFLKIYGPKNMKKLADFMKNNMIGSLLFKQSTFPFYTLNSTKIKIKNFTIQTLPIKHSKVIPEIAYKFSAHKKTMVYSGDLGPLIDKNKFIRFCQNANLLIADSAGEPSKPSRDPGDHLTPYQVGEIAQKAKVKKLVLTHQTVKSEKSIINDCKKSYSGKIIVAKDLMKIKI